MSDRDRLLSYVTENLDEIKHYINYRGRSYQDLVNLQKEIDELTLAITTRLVRDFKHIPEMAELLKIKE